MLKLSRATDDEHLGMCQQCVPHLVRHVTERRDPGSCGSPSSPGRRGRASLRPMRPRPRTRGSDRTASDSLCSDRRGPDTDVSLGMPRRSRSARSPTVLAGSSPMPITADDPSGAPARDATSACSSGVRNRYPAGRVKYSDSTPRSIARSSSAVGSRTARLATIGRPSTRGSSDTSRTARGRTTGRAVEGDRAGRGLAAHSLETSPPAVRARPRRRTRRR